jgi:hypothetical protein
LHFRFHRIEIVGFKIPSVYLSDSWAARQRRPTEDMKNFVLRPFLPTIPERKKQQD